MVSEYLEVYRCLTDEQYFYDTAYRGPSLSIKTGIRDPNALLHIQPIGFSMIVLV